MGYYRGCDTPHCPLPICERTLAVVLRLMPVFELEPGNLARRYAGSRDSPDTNAPDDAWEAWLLACLRDAGIDDLRPIAKRSWLFSIEQLQRVTTMERILEDHFDKSGSTMADAATDRKNRAALAGGFVLMAGQGVLVEPGCCCDLSNLAEWAQAAHALDGSWKMLWIGHPWRSVRLAGGALEISAAHEGSPQALEVACRVDAAELADAVERARVALHALADRLYAAIVIHVGSPSLAASLARSLAGLDASD